MKYILLSLLAIASLSVSAQTEPKQCQATTSKGVQCMRKAKEGTKDNSYCSQHNPERPHCAGTTGSGTPCKRPVRKEGDKCNDHYFQKKA